VGYVKVEVAKKHGIPFECQELVLDGRPMADPFSLSDYPALKASRKEQPLTVQLRRVVPSDGEEEEDGGPAPVDKDDPEEDGYEDESFDE